MVARIIHQFEARRVFQDLARSFNIDPTGNFLYSCNQRSDAIAAFRINRDTGAPTFTGQYTAVGTPAIIIFLG